MNIIMVGIDYKTAALNIREKFSFTSHSAEQFLKQIKTIQGVLGIVLISTCNRTELYLSCDDTFTADPFSLFNHCIHTHNKNYTSYFVVHKNHAVLEHLMEVTSGLCSQIRGENQIIGQVKTAISLARECGCTDAILETIFRNAISAGKKTRTIIPLTSVDTSVAHRAIEVLQEHIPTLNTCKILVLGNGEMGRLIISNLSKRGCHVTGTYRFHRQKTVEVFQDCELIPFPAIYDNLHDKDILISATTSCHYVVDYEQTKNCKKIPAYWMDLAVPRDIDPQVATLSNIKHYWNVDSLSNTLKQTNDQQKIQAIKQIHQHYINRFYDWLDYRNNLLLNT